MPPLGPHLFTVYVHLLSPRTASVALLFSLFLLHIGHWNMEMEDTKTSHIYNTNNINWWNTANSREFIVVKVLTY